MKKIVLGIALFAAIYFGLSQTGGLHRLTGRQPTQAQTSPASLSNELGNAIAQKRSGTQVTGDGVVTKLLADDTEGSRHQRFILTPASGQTLLIVHNIDLAPRIDSLKSGDTVAFNGVYEWNAKGGVVHWTHHDPSGRHQASWLKHAGQTYQ